MLKIKIPWEILKSTLTVLAVSSIAGLGVYLINGKFWSAFLLIFALQYIVFTFIGTIIKNYFTQKTYQKQLDTLENLSTILECAYCDKSNVMTFLPDQNERAEFECVSCKKKNLVNIQFVVARVTEPVIVNNLTSPSLLPLQDENK